MSLDLDDIKEWKEGNEAKLRQAPHKRPSPSADARWQEKCWELDMLKRELRRRGHLC